MIMDIICTRSHDCSTQRVLANRYSASCWPQGIHEPATIN